MFAFCGICGLRYSHKRNLNVHTKSMHPTKVADPIPVRVPVVRHCVVCDLNIKKEEFGQHLAAVHDVNVVETTHTFSSFEEFEVWKLSVERETCSAFRKYHGDEQNRKNIKRMSFRCNRSGTYTGTGSGIRHLKAQRSMKIGGYCPAEMKVTVDKDGKCAVRYIPTHFGHNRELVHISLTSEERKLIATKIAAQIPFSVILDDIRQNLSGKVSRLHLLTRKDLHNIRASINSSSGRMLSCDAVNDNSPKLQIDTEDEPRCNEEDEREDEAQVPAPCEEEDAVLAIKGRVIPTLEAITARVTDTRNADELAAAEKLLSSVLPAMAAARPASSGPQVNLKVTDGSRKRNVEPEINGNVVPQKKIAPNSLAKPKKFEFKFKGRTGCVFLK